LIREKLPVRFCNSPKVPCSFAAGFHLWGKRMRKIFSMKNYPFFCKNGKEDVSLIERKRVYYAHVNLYGMPDKDVCVTQIFDTSKFFGRKIHTKIV
jgi:hypothetical protein